MNYQQAYAHVIQGANGGKAAGEMNDKALEWVVLNAKNPANVEAAQVVLAQRIADKAAPKPVPAAQAYLAEEVPPEFDDGIGPSGVWEQGEVSGPPANQETALTVSQPQELSVSIHPVGVESLPDFDSMEQDIPLNMKKFEFQSVGQELRGLYIGIQRMHKNDKGFDSAVFQRKDGLLWVAGIDLTSKLAPIPTGTPVLVRFQGTKNLGNGNRLSMFDVFSMK